jgi:hypothetical protein
MAIAALAMGCTGLPTELVTDDRSAIKTLETEHRVVGVASDRAGGLWIATWLAHSDYYGNDEIRVAHVDPNGTETRRFTYNDEFTDVHGLAFSGDALWLNYGGTSSGNHHVRRLDPDTGARAGSFALPLGIVDLDVRDGELLLSNLWNEVLTLDATTGGVTERRQVTAFEDSIQRGIATTDDGSLWVADWGAGVYRLGSDGGATSSIRPIDIAQSTFSHIGPYLAWDGSHLIIALDRRIAWYRP